MSAWWQLWCDVDTCSERVCYGRDSLDETRGDGKADGWARLPQGDLLIDVCPRHNPRRGGV